MARQPRAFKPRTTFSETGPGLKTNWLRDREKPTALNQVWVTDITYLPLQDGSWTYLAACSDVFTRRVVGWHVMATMPEALVRTALQRALALRQPPKGLIRAFELRRSIWRGSRTPTAPQQRPAGE